MNTKVTTLLTIVLLLPIFLFGKVKSVQFKSKSLVLEGKAFGEIGSYELLKGTVFYEFDPDSYFNSQITDVELARTNAYGKVEASGDIVVLQPTEPSKRSGIAIVEVSNRGGKFSLRYFNKATKSGILDPNDPEYWGDELLMEQGVTIIWIGWQFDLPEKQDLLNFNAPSARQRNGQLIEGWVRSDWTVDEFTTTLALSHRNEEGYKAITSSDADHKLYVRDGRDAPRQLVDRKSWSFGRDENGVRFVSDRHITMEGGFLPGKIYELVYKSANPMVVGTGMAAVRDIIAYAKYDSDCPFPVKRSVAVGVSQTGRFLRQFLYQGFNFDETGQKAYDGIMIMTAGAGRGSFNHRFGQPSRDAHRYSAFFYPTDIFPFTTKEITDPITKEKDGLLRDQMTEQDPPKIFQINTGYEYWGRAASLIHTDVEGKTDIAPSDSERIYHIASAQHYVDAFPPKEKSGDTDFQYEGNFLDMKYNYRALLLAMIEWVKEDKDPPASRYPTLENKTLVAKEKLDFPSISGLRMPTTIHQAYRVNYGESWKDGIIEIQPPKTDLTYPVLVPQVDDFGNETGGIRNVEIEVPLGTYTPWSIRENEKGGYHELQNCRGQFIPLTRHIWHKNIESDPRPSIQELYSDKGAYIKKVEDAAEVLVFNGYLLERDIPYILQRNSDYWDWLTGDRRNIQSPELTFNGTIVMWGGGIVPADIYQLLKSEVGADNAKIVVITSGNKQAQEKEFKKRIEDKFRSYNFKKVEFIDVEDPRDASQNTLKGAFHKAKGIWIMDGDVVKLQRIYQNSNLKEELQGFLQSGGMLVVNGASAQFLGEKILINGEERSGLGLLNKTIIEPGFLLKNNHLTLQEYRRKNPKIFGLGVDDRTGLLIKNNMLTVMGHKYIGIFDDAYYDKNTGSWFEKKGQYSLLEVGEQYDLGEMKVK